MDKTTETQESSAKQNVVMDRGWLARTLVLLLLLIGSGTYYALDIEKPFADDGMGWGAGFHANIARNYLDFGLAGTRGAMVLNNHPDSPEEFKYYINHPPLAGWLLAGSMYVCGEQHKELSMRIVPVLMTLASIMLLYFIVKKIAGSAVALLATALFAILPMVLHYGTAMDVQGPVLLFFCLILIAAYQRFRDNPTTVNALLMLAAFLPAAMTDWPAWYLAGILPVHFFITAKRKNWKIILLPVLAVLCFFAYMAYASYVLTGETGFETHQLVSIFLSRAGAGASNPAEMGGFTAKEWFDRVIADWLVKFFTPVILGLAAIWLIISIAAVCRRRADNRHWMFLALLAFGALHVGLFRQGALEHEFWSYYLTVSMVLGAACSTIIGGRRLVRGNAILVTVLALIVIGATAFVSFGTISDKRKSRYFSYAEIGRIVQGQCPADVIILSDVGYRYSMDLYVTRNRIDEFLLAPCNFQVMQENPRNYFLFITQNGGPDENFRSGFIEMTDQVIALPNGKRVYPRIGKWETTIMISTQYISCKFHPQRIEIGLLGQKPAITLDAPAPVITECVLNGTEITVKWDNPAPGRVTGYRAYITKPHSPYFTDYYNLGMKQETHYDNKDGKYGAAVIVALYENGESGYTRKIMLLDEDKTRK